MQGVGRGMTLLLQNKTVFHDFMKRDGVAYFSTLECFFRNTVLYYVIGLVS